MKKESLIVISCAVLLLASAFIAGKVAPTSQESSGAVAWFNSLPEEKDSMLLAGNEAATPAALARAAVIMAASAKVAKAAVDVGVKEAKAQVKEAKAKGGKEKGGKEKGGKNSYLSSVDFSDRAFDVVGSKS